jgi:hypothetical protein
MRQQSRRTRFGGFFIARTTGRDLFVARCQIAVNWRAG